MPAKASDGIISGEYRSCYRPSWRGGGDREDLVSRVIMLLYWIVTATLVPSYDSRRFSLKTVPSFSWLRHLYSLRRSSSSPYPLQATRVLFPHRSPCTFWTLGVQEGGCQLLSLLPLLLSLSQAHPFFREGWEGWLVSQVDRVVERRWYMLRLFLFLQLLAKSLVFRVSSYKSRIPRLSQLFRLANLNRTA